MDKLVIQGGNRLQGSVRISGAKNAALPILASCLLTDEPCRLEGVPDLKDVDVMLQLMRELGVSAERQADGAIQTQVVDPSLVMASYEIVRQMRASVCLLGPLLGRRGTAIVSMPGGCVIGTRPIDLHLKGLRGLGTTLGVEGGYVHATSERLQGAEIDMAGPRGSTVLGTANVLMAAVMAEGTTVIQHAAREPEIVNLIDSLNARGARITGGGSSRLEVEGVAKIGGGTIHVIPDRIEAETFMVAGAITRGDITLSGVVLEHIAAASEVLERMGVTIRATTAVSASPASLASASSAGLTLSDLQVTMTERARATDFVTEPYPGFPTDAQAQVMALLALSEGTGRVTEGIYPDRFMHVAELSRMGADIQRDGDTCLVRGVPELSGAPVTASDLRASAALVPAGLVARGTTDVERIYHIDRGYERIEERLRGLGADVQRARSTLA